MDFQEHLLSLLVIGLAMVGIPLVCLATILRLAPSEPNDKE